LDVGHEPPLETRPQALFERRDLAGWTIGGDDDLLPGLVERVERVEELLLDPLLVLEELDVVDEEHAECPVALLETLDSFIAKRVDEVVHEALTRYVTDREVAEVLSDVVADCLKEGGFTGARPPVEEG